MDELLFKRFRILQKLGSGGSSQVFQAFDERMERNVAIKRIPKSSHTIPRAIREAKTVALLVHPNIVTVHDFLEDDKFFYLVMEQIEGVDLAELISNKKFSWQQAIAATLQISHALECAHSNYIIHRDIKPANLILLPDGRIKVLDFGISRLKDSDVRTSEKIIGTMAYISPEQARAEPVDERSDLFSLGIVAYEMLTGENPFMAETYAATIFKILHNTPDHPSIMKPRIPQEIGDIVMKLLEKHPEDRFESAVAMRYKFERFSDIDEQNELKKLAGTKQATEQTQKVKPKKLKLGIPDAFVNRSLFGLLAFILAFTISISSDVSIQISSIFGVILFGFTFYLPRLGLLALLFLFTVRAAAFYVWLVPLVLPLLILYFAMTKYQKPLLSFLPFTAPILANINVAFSFPIIVGHAVERPAQAIAPTFLGGLLIIIHDLFIRDTTRFLFVESPKFGKQTVSSMVFFAELGSVFAENPLLLLQPILFTLASIFFVLLKQSGNKKLGLWSLIINLFIFGAFYLMAPAVAGQRPLTPQLLYQTVFSQAVMLIVIFLFNKSSKIDSEISLEKDGLKKSYEPA